ncbi:Gamma-glutamyltranspeptidase [Lunatimonas lonarensis]|uniref:Glutathione hydrolase proenzyme n=2 Tax=Lunatimonas lonarensis TaxID=1232681 RepID=R7ZYB8_9BACT|nr:Gamma-glutamyltranspeptidase [Lunatimonas lonarensis]
MPLSTKRIFRLFLLVMGFLLISELNAQVAKENLRPAAIGKRGMVATANPLVSLAGQEMLINGGNAIDAIVAAAAALNAVEPYMSGVAGVGYLLYYDAKENRTRSLVFGGWVPESFDPDKLREVTMAEDGAGHGALETVGPKIVAVPGNLAGWDRALKDYGSMTLHEVFAPAIKYLEEGVPITEFDQAMWEGTLQRVLPHPESVNILLKDDRSTYQIGDFFTNNPLAKTMRQIAEKGADFFYKGELAEEIETAFLADGGFLTAKDLAKVPEKVNWVDPIRITYKGYTVYNNPPPGMGIQQLQTLKIMEGFDVQRMGHNSSEYLAHLLETIFLCRLDTDRYIGDPDFVDVPVAFLLSDAYLNKQRDLVRQRLKERMKAAEIASEEKISGAAVDREISASYQYATTSLSVVDQWGNAAVIIQTHGGGFGSGYVAGKTGLIFNSALDWMSKEPGLANSVAPGKAVGWCVGGMMQFHKDGRPMLIVGSPGSFGILQSVPQVAMNHIDFGMNIQDAISAPRFRWKDELGSVPATEAIVETRMGEQVLEDLQRMGFQLDTSLGPWSMTVGGAQGITLDPVTGWLMGGADPRRNGYAVGW